MMGHRKGIDLTVYRPTARLLHWLMALLILLQLTAGLVMVVDWPEGHVVGRIVNTLHVYDVHKLTGFGLLGLVCLRLAYRVFAGAPDDEPTLTTWQREVSHLVHYWIYFLLIIVPLTGWLGVSLYPALVALGVHLPALVQPDRAKSAIAFVVHAYAAYILIGLLAMHIGAALYHYVIRRDGVLQRMLPSLRRHDL